MSRDLFTSVDPATTSSKQWYTVPLSILAHVIALFVFVVVPLVANNVLPTPESVMVVTVPPPPPPAPAPPAPPPRAEVPPPPTPVFANRDAAPLVAPRETPEPPRTLAVVPRGIDEGMLRGRSVALAPPPPAPGRSDPVPVGGDIRPPRKLKDAAPVYPTVARAAKIDGIVIVEATIAKDGSVRNARVLRGNPLLDQAALDAVNQWRFSPTLLNGEAVEVIMSVTVNFRLQ